MFLLPLYYGMVGEGVFSPPEVTTQRKALTAKAAKAGKNAKKNLYGFSWRPLWVLLATFAVKSSSWRLRGENCFSLRSYGLPRVFLLAGFPLRSLRVWRRGLPG